MSALELARAIYQRHRESRRRTDAPMPPWEQLSLSQQQKKISAAQKLQQAYKRELPNEVRLTP